MSEACERVRLTNAKSDTFTFCNFLKWCLQMILPEMWGANCDELVVVAVAVVVPEVVPSGAIAMT